ncbi:MAG: DUF5684 domain-containing protein [Chthonomonadales bacterium]
MKPLLVFTLLIGGHVLYWLPLFVIARKCANPFAWLAFIPLANLWLMCDLADRDIYWILLVLLPGVGVILFELIMWPAIAENTNKPAWLGLLMIFPLINLAAGYYMAMVDTGDLVA